MRSLTVWKIANRPNYVTNVDKQFPYSEVPYLGEYSLLKIPTSVNGSIPHVDYWGEGRIVSDEGVRGFANCYNVNHQYQLVSGGPDLDKKIPNRIPVLNYNNCDTSGYIKSNSVITVTVAGGQGHLTSSCAKDIARIVNKEVGKVVVYGVNSDSDEIRELIVELSRKGLYLSPKATLPRELEGLTYYDKHVSFFIAHDLKDEFYNDVVEAKYDTAVKMAKNLEVAAGDLIKDTVTRLISSAPRNLMSFAYKLWNGDAKNIVRNFFPKAFQHIMGENAVTIVNKGYLLPLKLDVHTDYYNDRLAWGDNSRVLTSNRVSWKIIPLWVSNKVVFKLYNIDCNMYLKLDVNVDSYGDRQAWGSSNSGEERHKYYLEPLIKNDTLVFFIINYEYGQGLKLDANTDRYGDRLLWGHNGSVNNDQERLRWIIAAW